MRVGLVCPYDLSKPGGVQGQVLGLARSLRDLGDQTVVIGPGLSGQIEGIDLGGTVSVPGNKSRAPISLSPRVGRRIAASARDLDLLHVHEPLMPSVSLAALRVGPPVVATFHADPGRFGRGVYAMLGERLGSALGGNTRRVTAVSTAAAAPLPAGMTVSIVPNGLDVASMRVGVERDPRRVVFLGRDEPRKGLDVLLAAWPAVVEAVPDAALAVMGSDRGIPGIEWMGRVDDETKAEVLSSAAVYVAPNTGGESFGVVLIEAMAAGAAVVASDLPAFEEVADDAARFFGRGDAHGMARAVIDLLGDEEQRDALAGRGIRRAWNFDWGRVAARYRALYEDCLADPGST